MENNELIKEIERLQGLLMKHGICEDCGELYNHHFDEPFASCDCKQSEWYELTPHMKQVSELKAERDALAEAGRAGFLECASHWNALNAFGEFVTSEEIKDVADEYAAKVRQGS